MPRLLLAILISLLLGSAAAQPTVGLQQYTEDSYNGFTLLSPILWNEVYLLNNCGQLVHSWQLDSLGVSAYLLEDGSLMRMARVFNPIFSVEGAGGRIEHYDWDGNLLWGYNYGNAAHYAHHDIEPLPNGNVLVLAWQFIHRDTAVAYGRDASLSTDLWPSQVVELQPIGSDSAAVVWQWNLWDHLVQDTDPGKPNYGVVANQPELLDINYIGTPAPGLTTADWIHANAIDYNADRDEIVISSRNMNEIWVIDHSTTTAEAAGHSGGNKGKGGDFLYRWGNPAAYQRGDTSDQQLFGQHDPNWINGWRGQGEQLMIFNNGITHSTVEVITPPHDASGNYIIPTSGPIGPAAPYYTYTATPLGSFLSLFISGARPMPNGNILICEGMTGRLFEVNEAEEIVWEYTNPVGSAGPVAQGDTAMNNFVFRLYRYPPGYPAFTGKDLSPKGYVELEPDTSSGCTILGFTINEETGIAVWPNPVSDNLQISLSQSATLEIFDSSGQLLESKNLAIGLTTVNCAAWPTGIYVLQLQTPKGMQTVKLLKL